MVSQGFEGLGFVLPLVEIVEAVDNHLTWSPARPRSGGSSIADCGFGLGSNSWPLEAFARIIQFTAPSVQMQWYQSGPHSMAAKMVTSG
jgi:hypothetical protein